MRKNEMQQTTNNMKGEVTMENTTIGGIMECLNTLTREELIAKTHLVTKVMLAAYITEVTGEEFSKRKLTATSKEVLVDRAMELYVANQEVKEELEAKTEVEEVTDACRYIRYKNIRAKVAVDLWVLYGDKRKKYSFTCPNKAFQFGAKCIKQRGANGYLITKNSEIILAAGYDSYMTTMMPRLSKSLVWGVK